MHGWIGGSFGTEVLRWLSPRGGRTGCSEADAYAGQGKLDALLPAEAWRDVVGRVVLDFGCGTGAGCLELARHGAREVIGLDIRERVLEQGRARAAEAGLQDVCRFTQHVDEPVDTILTIDAFEHFDDPAGVLRVMRSLLAADGCVWAVFGPTWFHPHGGHLFSVFPWAHLLFTEEALVRWRADFKSDGARRFGEVEGGLNQMTIRRFERLVAASPLRSDRMELVPIRRLKPFASRLTREVTTAIVRCRLVPR